MHLSNLGGAVPTGTCSVMTEGSPPSAEGSTPISAGALAISAAMPVPDCSWKSYSVRYSGGSLPYTVNGSTVEVSNNGLPTDSLHVVDNLSTVYIYK